MKRIITAGLIALVAATAIAREYHVATAGDNAAEGSAAQPLRTIAEAARRAGPGDVITVHAGVYRERIDPPRGGTSEHRRITYQAAPGERVVIKGSELVRGWTHVQHDTWKVTIPNSFFGDFNPYADLIRGDWFWPSRDHHTGAVYLDGHWLTEAARLDDVLQPVGAAPQPRSGPFLVNVAWIRPAGADGEHGRVSAAAYAAQSGVQTAPCDEGGHCIGWIEHGDWAAYEGVDFGSGTEQLEIRASSGMGGGVIDIRRDAPNGALLGTCTVPSTGGWQSWRTYTPTIERVAGVQRVCLVFRDPGRPATRQVLWFARVDERDTTIWAQLPDARPNEDGVEINVRQSVFYPSRPGVNYITVRGFTMMHAATPWAPPTAEQIGLIGTHWSKGWIIEDNDISYSVCVGVTLGKYGDEYDNKSQDSARGYVETIERALERGWSRRHIGNHIVRNNHISYCEQAGIVGSMGCAYSTITGNEIHDIHVQHLYNGAEMAAIKFHGAIDTEISRNRVYRSTRGIWLDWMTQGTRVTRNLLHDNGPCEDLFVEVNHGPFMIDHNLFLSDTALADWSQGGAYVHNLFTGRIHAGPVLDRETPWLNAHATTIAGLSNTRGGDNRFYNNVFVGPAGLATYDNAAQKVFVGGNVYLNGAEPLDDEPAADSALLKRDFDPDLQLDEHDGGATMQFTFERDWATDRTRSLVTSQLLGKAAIPALPYQQPDRSSYHIDEDWFGRPRDESNPFPGPFELPAGGRRKLQVWPVGDNGPDR